MTWQKACLHALQVTEQIQTVIKYPERRAVAIIDSNIAFGSLSSDSLAGVRQAAPPALRLTLAVSLSLKRSSCCRVLLDMQAKPRYNVS